MSLLDADFKSVVSVSICKAELSAYAVIGASGKELFQTLGLNCPEIIFLD